MSYHAFIFPLTQKVNSQTSTKSELQETSRGCRVVLGIRCSHSLEKLLSHGFPEELLLILRDFKSDFLRQPYRHSSK